MNERALLYKPVIRRVPIFQSADDDEISAIASLSAPRAVEEGGYFFFQGDKADYLYIMMSGRAKLCSIGADGHQVNLRTLNPYQLFGAIGAVQPQAVYPACAQVLEDSMALAIPTHEFHVLLETHPRLSFSLMQLMTSYIQEMQERYREMATERVEQRIARVLLRLASQAGKRYDLGVLIELPFSRQDLAEMAGTTLYTVSRTLSAWEKRGLIATGRERVTLSNPHAIVRLAEGIEEESEI